MWKCSFLATNLEIEALYLSLFVNVANLAIVLPNFPALLRADRLSPREKLYDQNFRVAKINVVLHAIAEKIMG